MMRHKSGYWTEETIIKELKDVITYIGHFPTQTKLKSIGRYDLLDAINNHGGSIKFQKILGYEPVIKPPNFWNDSIIIKELQDIINKIGHFPTTNELIYMSRYDLNDAIRENGGINYFRNLTGHRIVQASHGYWTKDVIIENLRKIKDDIGHFPTYSELESMKRYDLCHAIIQNRGINKFRNIFGLDTINHVPNYWNDETILNELKQIIEKINHFPSKNELIIIKRADLSNAIDTHGGVLKFKDLLNIPISERDKYKSKLATYCIKRGKSSENIVKQIIQDYCSIHNLPEPHYNVKLSKGNILEFVCNTNKRIGIDVTNTEHYNVIRHKWKHQEYHNHLDELWIVVFSDVFTPDDYLKFNENSPDNVKIFSIYDFLKEINYSTNQLLQSKIDKYCSCSFHNKEELKNK